MIEVKNFIDLNNDEMHMVLEWRNSSYVRRSMYNSEEIALSDHLDFVDDLKINKSKQYFLVKNQGLNVGVIYFSSINAINAEMGIYSNPNLRGQGPLLMDLIFEHAFGNLKLSKLNLEVFADNLKAIKLYENAGFIKYSTRKVNNKEVICMELNNEDR